MYISSLLKVFKELTSFFFAGTASNAEYVAEGFETMSRNARLGLDPWTGMVPEIPSTAMVPYNGRYGNNLFPSPDVNDGAGGVPVNHGNGTSTDPNASPNSLEVEEVPSKMTNLV